MRITSGLYYKNMYDNNNKVQSALFDVNKQIASTRSIQYSYEDTTTFVQTMRLDNEIVTFNQVLESTESGLKFSQQSDTTIGEIVKTLDSFKVKVIQATTDAQSDTSLEAIADELEGMRRHLLNLANTSINDQYLFGGTATGTLPFNEDGTYNGNDDQIRALTGSGIFQSYNVTGQDLFFGEEPQIRRKITTNVPQLNKVEQFPEVLTNTTLPANSGKEVFVTASDTIRELIGDVNSQVDIDNGTAGFATTYFYLRGTQHDGTTFKQKIDVTGDESIQSLLDKVGDAFGNTPINEVVDVRLNERGQIEIEDKLNGSTKLDFHLVAATDFDLTDGVDNGDIANTTNSIDDLDVGESSFSTLISGNSVAANPNLLITEFTTSGYGAAAPNAIEGISYDRVAFDQKGSTLTALVPQTLSSDNSFAVDSTKLSEVASGGSLDGVTLNLEGTDINGAAYTATVNLSNAGSTFTVGGSTFTIFNTGVDPKQPISAANPQSATAADDMTYRQLMDVVNMVVTDNLPASAAGVNAQGIAADYGAAIDAANLDGETRLTVDGRIEFEEIGQTTTAASISLYDGVSDDFTDTNPANDPNVDAAASMVFHGNTALTISDPKTNFFERIDEIITAVREQKTRADGTTGDDPRNAGMQNGITMVDDLLEHFSREQSQSGSNSQSLTATRNRTEVLILSSTLLRSDVLDTDIAEATIKLQQLTLNYQAMASSVARVSQLSLVNYL